jgi:hypothetical protein
MRGYKAIAISQRGGKCEYCGFRADVQRVYHFHHRDRATKHRDLSEISTWDEFWEEVKKCDLLCANCHAIEEDRLTKVRRSERESKRNKPETAPPLFADLHTGDA